MQLDIVPTQHLQFILGPAIETFIFECLAWVTAKLENITNYEWRPWWSSILTLIEQHLLLKGSMSSAIINYLVRKLDVSDGGTQLISVCHSLPPDEQMMVLIRSHIVEYVNLRSV